MTQRIVSCPRAIALAGAVAALAGSISSQASGVVRAEQRIANDEAGFQADIDDGDRLASALAWVGDLDGDGLDELAVGAPGDDDGGADRGAVYVLFLNADGSVRAEQKLSSLAGGFGAGLDDGDALGSALGALGDFDGDGLPDLVAGAPGNDDGGTDRGAVYVLLLNADGTLRSKSKIASGGFAGLDDGDAFGSAVTSVLDLNDDGVLDVAAGAPGDDDGGPDRGAAWILFLDATGGVLSTAKISHTAGGFTGTLADGDGFGSALGLPGDVDLDGTVDLAVGAPFDDDGGAERGAVWTVFLNGAGGVLDQRKLSSTAGGFGGTLADGDHFGSALAGLGDVDGNSIPDLFVGAPGVDGGGSDRGAAWYVLLDFRGAAIQQLAIAAGSGGFVGPLANGDLFGAALAAGGELDADGFQELAVGAPGDSASGFARGALWILFTRVTRGSTTVNPGSGINPDALVPGQADPRIGRVWDPIIDLIVLGALRGEPIFHVLGVSDSRFNNARILVIGELLISLDPVDLRGLFLSAPGMFFQIPIPNDVNLVGRQLFTQGAQVDVNGVILTNGLDIVIGF